MKRILRVIVEMNENDAWNWSERDARGWVDRHLPNKPPRIVKGFNAVMSRERKRGKRERRRFEAGR